ncbi:AaceriAFR610Wp [[Ashbya] aceris (nom. inval.)]|nr:AaceriAFR610Wp [[Ashbya] aceris (nom. inval.)]
MDRAQPFIKKCLLVKAFTDPSKPIDEKRLLDTLLLQPTDGGLGRRLKKRKANLLKVDGTSMQVKHDNYRVINKNSKVALRAFINGARTAAAQANKIASEKKLKTREELNDYLKEHHLDIYSSLPRYEQYEPMYTTLWSSYMRELLNLDDGKAKAKPTEQAALQKLSMADYNGSLLVVSKSRNANMVGLKGIVIWDAQKSFVIVCKGRLTDTLKLLPKKGSVFTFEVPVEGSEPLQYSIIGDRFNFRSADRAGRKFKSRCCDDLLYYIDDDTL